MEPAQRDSTPLHRFVQSRIAWAVLGPAVALGFLGLVLKLVLKVHAGAGLDTYFSGFGVKLNYIGVLVTLVVMLLALAVVPAIRWWTERDERSFDRKYPQAGTGPPPRGGGEQVAALDARKRARQ